MLIEIYRGLLKVREADFGLTMLAEFHWRLIDVEKIDKS